MVYNYNDSKIFYKFYHGKSRSPTILLHGWGCDSSIFKNLVDSFPSRSFLVIDFPPFGKSEKEIKDWNIFTYVGMLMSLCEHLDIESCDLIGHSFVRQRRHETKTHPLLSYKSDQIQAL